VGRNLRYYQAAAILLIVFAVLTAIQTAIASVDTTDLPSEFQTIWSGIVYVFTTSAATPLWVFIRNVYGYAENYLGTDPLKREKLRYESSQLMATWMKYEAYIKAFTAMMLGLTVGTPLQPYAVYIAGGLAFLVDVIRKSLADIAES